MVASLESTAIVRDLQAAYAPLTTNAPQDIHVFAAFHEEKQATHVRSHNERALADVWLLSYAETLIVTPMSTYGYLAYALSNADVWLLGEGGCSRMSREPCYHFPPRAVQCRTRVGIRSVFNATDRNQSSTMVCEDNPGIGVKVRTMR